MRENNGQQDRRNQRQDDGSLKPAGDPIVALYCRIGRCLESRTRPGPHRRRQGLVSHPLPSDSGLGLRALRHELAERRGAAAVGEAAEPEGVLHRPEHSIVVVGRRRGETGEASPCNEHGHVPSAVGVG